MYEKACLQKAAFCLIELLVFIKQNFMHDINCQGNCDYVYLLFSLFVLFSPYLETPLLQRAKKYVLLPGGHMSQYLRHSNKWHFHQVF